MVIWIHLCINFEVSVTNSVVTVDIRKKNKANTATKLKICHIAIRRLHMHITKVHLYVKSEVCMTN